ncbi:MAG: 16S rRNA (cytidine(1402)-2'-O)-methyltransferase [Solirubrobacterales bacterium]
MIQTVAGRLTVCPTPIGNLRDLSPRVQHALTDADLVACEDTRRTGRLLDLLDLPKARLVSYHEHNEDRRTDELVRQMERGDRVALVSDAGTPTISDPGYRLVAVCRARGLDVEVLPGPSAAVTALVSSGLPAHRWRFEGYLPRRTGELERILAASETVVAFESPRRLAKSLAALAALAPDRPAAVCRELTKLHEEVAVGPLGELARRFGGEVQGEVTVVLGAAPQESGPDQASGALAVDAARRLVESGARPRAAVSVVATLTGTRANDLYRALTGRESREG